MTDYTARQKRYMRDPLPVRLGGLAANMARINSFSNHPENDLLVYSLLDESKHFIEWTAAEAECEVAEELVTLQVNLAQWQRTWETLWHDPEHRSQLANTAKQWSDRVLGLSGLLN